jgi:predicted amidophosphoribosyltransferase
VRRLKYDDLPALGPALGAELAARVQRLLPGLPPETLVVPVPLHPLRRVRRGYNQAHEIARGLGDALGLELGEPLRRKRYTRALYGLAHRRRAAALLGAFRVVEAAPLGRPILLVDDVRTSGATLRAAARALHRAGAGKIRAAVIAR